MASGIRLAVPSHSSRLYEVALSAVREALPDEQLDLDSTRALARTLPSGLELVFCRGTDIPMLVASGFADAGLTGYDVVVERVLAGGERLDMRSLAPRRASEVCLVTVPGRTGVRMLYSEYPRLSRQWADTTLAYHRAEIAHIHGSAEGLIALDARACGVVLVTTGETLRANGLIVEYPIIATDLCVVRRGQGMSTLGNLVIDALPPLAMPQFAVANEPRWGW